MKIVEWVTLEKADRCKECGSNLEAGSEVLEHQRTGAVWCESCGRMVEGENWADQELV